MCGIFGIFERTGKKVDVDMLSLMGQSLRHRGPDDHGIYVKNGVGIGNQRLAIVDIKNGHQPFISADGKTVVVQNGEIYNYVELGEKLKKEGLSLKTRSDTEVILLLYEYYGIEFVSLLNGMFSIAIYDGRQDKLYLIRDRIGVKPLYIFDDGKRFLFASEIKALLKTNIETEINLQGLDLFLSYNYVPPPQTIYKNIFHLLPGHFLCVDIKGQKMQQWWDLAKQHVVPNKKEEVWIKEIQKTLADAVRIRVPREVPYGAFLSGGIDSASIVGMMAGDIRRPIKTFSIGFQDPRFDETAFAKEIATRFNTNMFTEKLGSELIDDWPLITHFLDQPHGDVSFLPTYRLSKLAVEQVKVVLTGDGGDELFAGYDKYQSFFSKNKDIKTQAEFQNKYFDTLSLFNETHKRQLYHEDILQEMSGIDQYGMLDTILQKVRHMDFINQALYLDTVLLLPGNNLVKPDRMGMAVSLEARIPLLDYRMVELAFTMPGNLKLKEGITKYIYKKAVVDLLGKQTAYRKKQMFTVPIGEWFKNEISVLCKSIIESMPTDEGALFKKTEISHMFAEHQSGKTNFTKELRAIFSVEIWRRIFMKKKYLCHSVSWSELL